MTRLPKDPPQPADSPLDVLTLAVGLGGPAAELVVGDRGGLVEVLAVEEEAADDAAEDAARAGVGRRGPLQKDFADRAGAAVGPEHAGVGIEAAERDAVRRLRLAVYVRDRAHVGA